MASAAKFIIRLKDHRTRKDPWNIHYQRLGEVFLTRKSNFTQTFAPGEFLNDNVFDNTGQFAAFLSASMFLSMLWPDASRTFRLVPVPRIKDMPQVAQFFRDATQEMHMMMDKPRAGLSLALMSYFLDEGIFGTGGVGTFEGDKDNLGLPVLYEGWDIKSMHISENAQGFVDEIFLVIEKTAEQVLEEYGNDDRVSSKVRELVESGKGSEKIEILKVLEPKKPAKGKRGIAAMPVRSTHIDTKHGIIMRERGFEEMPVNVGRMFKTTDEVYGRSSGMLALPPASSLNALSEGVLVATEKQLDPPLGVLDDGRLGGAVVDTSAGSLNVFNTQGRIDTRNPIFPLFTVGELTSAEKLKNQLTNEVMQAFFLDRLLDLNNQTQMTAFETSIRNRMRGEALGSVFARQIMEVLTPTIERTFNILWRRGHFGLTGTGPGAKLLRLWRRVTGAATPQVPQVLLDAAELGLDVFEIEYISPARRFMKSEKLQGIFTATDAIVALSAVLPGITDNIDPDILAAQIFGLSGAPIDALRTKDAVTAIRAEAARQQRAQDALAAGSQVADITQKAASARAVLGTAGGKT